MFTLFFESIHITIETIIKGKKIHLKQQQKSKHKYLTISRNFYSLLFYDTQHSFSSSPLNATSGKRSFLHVVFYQSICLPQQA